MDGWMAAWTDRGMDLVSWTAGGIVERDVNQVFKNMSISHCSDTNY